MHLQCGNCGAELVVDGTQRTATCPYCASPSVIERPASHERPAPTFSLGFALDGERARAAVRRWQTSRGFFADSGIASAEIDAIRGIYVPAYLYSAFARSSYSAEIGENYQETQTYTTMVNGKMQVRTRTVTKTEWRSLAGAHAAYVLDVIVTASRALGNPELERLEPFDLRALRRYTPALLSGWIAEEPTLGPAECLHLARGEANGRIGQMLNAFMPGDSHRGLTYSFQLEHETADLVHVPVWVLAVRHHPEKPPLRVLVNGQTGLVFGVAPRSWWKIALVALVVVLALAGLFLAARYA